MVESCQDFDFRKYISALNDQTLVKLIQLKFQAVFDWRQGSATSYGSYFSEQMNSGVDICWHE